jgi:hypothetical protein
MKLSEIVEQLEKHPDLHLYLDKILKKNKKTQASYLESLNHLAYLLYLNGQEEIAKELLDSIIQVPFEGNYNTWTFVDSSLVLLAYLEREAENKLSAYKKTPFVSVRTRGGIHSKHKKESSSEIFEW